MCMTRSVKLEPAASAAPATRIVRYGGTKKLCLLLLLFVVPIRRPSVPDQFMTLSPNGKYLVNSFTNRPVFMTGEDAWELITELSNADVETYLADRAARGFNVIWVAAADNVYQSNPPQDYYGNVPFDGADFTNEDPSYWAHVDDVLQRAAAYKVTVMLDPAFVGLNPPSGYFTSYENSSDAVMTAYGTWLGNRYKNFPNVIWALGGDADPYYANIYTKLSDLATGLAVADTNHLITFEASRYTQNGGGGLAPGGGYSSLDVWPGPPSWLGLNWVYQTQPTVVSGCQSNYLRSPWLPPLMGEDWYELENNMTEFQVRQEGYWEVLSGCYLGRLFGNNSIWSFNSPNGENPGAPSWQSQLGSPGSVAQEYLGQLMRTREHWLLVPDITNLVLTGGYGSGATLSVAARTSDGQTIIAYFSDGNATVKTINMSMITSPSSAARAWWYNPQTSATTLIGVFPNSGSQNFTAPDGNDWVLVIDNASAHLPQPGSKSLAFPY